MKNKRKKLIQNNIRILRSKEHNFFNDFKSFCDFYDIKYTTEQTKSMGWFFIRLTKSNLEIDIGKGGVIITSTSFEKGFSYDDFYEWFKTNYKQEFRKFKLKNIL